MSDERVTPSMCAFAVSLGLTLSVAVPAWTQDLYALEGRAQREPTNVKVLLELGKQYTRKFDESRHQLDAAKAEDYLRRALKIDGANAEIIARYGVILCVQAREKNSKDLARDGLKELDRAVAGAPDNPVPRSLRGFVGVECPSEFNRLDQALNDLSSVEELLRKDPGLPTRYDLNVPQVYVKLGKCYRAKGNLANARKFWQIAVTTAPTSREGQTAARLLKKYN
jgi:tetratricopeptide (TPR) repeat protein